MTRHFVATAACLAALSLPFASSAGVSAEEAARL